MSRIWNAFSTKAKNILPSADENARPQHKGEHHTLLKLPNGKYGFANYAGPGTDIVKRVKRGDPPRTVVDAISQAHDIRYTLDPDNVRKADVKMLEALDEASAYGTDNMFNIGLADMVIRSKMAAEDLTCDIPKAAPVPLTPTSKKILEDKLAELEQRGYGKPEPEYVVPGKRLKERLYGNGVDIQDEQTTASHAVDTTHDKKSPDHRPTRPVNTTKDMKGRRVYSTRIRRFAKAHGMNRSAIRLMMSAVDTLKHKQLTHRQYVEYAARRLTPIVFKYGTITDRSAIKSMLKDALQ